MEQKLKTIRVGNFELIQEKEHIKVKDINGIASHRISLDTPKGILLRMAVDNDSVNWLQGYVTCMFNVLSCVPDEAFLEEINRSAVNCVLRHPELYGVKEDISDAEDAEILKDQKELNEAFESLKKI